jgi:putative endonuclease
VVPPPAPPHPPPSPPPPPPRPDFPSSRHTPSPPATDRRIALGRTGEDRSADWYSTRGYQIVERNWRSKAGEVDLVCARGDVVVFCEVKTRRTDRVGAPAEAVTRIKQLRLRRLAAEYLSRHVCGPCDVRFDVVAILGAELNVIEAAF